MIKLHNIRGCVLQAGKYHKTIFTERIHEDAYTCLILSISTLNVSEA